MIPKFSENVKIRIRRYHWWEREKYIHLKTGSYKNKHLLMEGEHFPAQNMSLCPKDSFRLLLYRRKKGKALKLSLFTFVKDICLNKGKLIRKGVFLCVAGRRMCQSPETRISGESMALNQDKNRSLGSWLWFPKCLQLGSRVEFQKTINSSALCLRFCWLVWVETTVLC